jgi:hypothetical protein
MVKYWELPMLHQDAFPRLIRDNWKDNVGIRPCFVLTLLEQKSKTAQEEHGDTTLISRSDSHLSPSRGAIQFCTMDDIR